MSTPSVWDLLKQRKFDQACARAEAEFQETGSVFPLRNKIFALLQLNRLDESIALSQHLLDLTKGDTDSDFIFLGVAQFLKNNPLETIRVWRKGLSAKYQDAAGGVEIPMLLLFAGISTRDNALQEEASRMLRRATKSSRIRNWPGPVARYLLGDISEQELQAQIDQQTTLQEKQTCQVEFYVATKLLAGGDKSAKTHLKACLAGGSVTFANPEPYLAKAQLK